MLGLTQEEFIALVRVRGYNLAEVGRLWGITRSRVSQIAADAERAPYWEYALWALPTRADTARVEARRRRVLASLRSTRFPTSRRHRDHGVADASRLPVEVGDIWVVRQSPGEHLPEGCEGIVQSLHRRAGDWLVDIRFAATGYQESFLLSYLNHIECFLSDTGRSGLTTTTTSDADPAMPP